MSASGLIYRHYGREIIQAFASEAKAELNSELLEEIYVKLYSGFVEHVDAIDNGISVGEDLKYNIRCAEALPPWPLSIVGHAHTHTACQHYAEFTGVEV